MAFNVLFLKNDIGSSVAQRSRFSIVFKTVCSVSENFMFYEEVYSYFKN